MNVIITSCGIYGLHCSVYKLYRTTEIHEHSSKQHESLEDQFWAAAIPEIHQTKPLPTNKKFSTLNKKSIYFVDLLDLSKTDGSGSINKNINN